MHTWYPINSTFRPKLLFLREDGGGGGGGASQSKNNVRPNVAEIPLKFDFNDIPGIYGVCTLFCMRVSFFFYEGRYVVGLLQP